MIEVISSGMFSTIQDQGRVGLRHLGVPVSGAIDHFSANLANCLLNNKDHAAVLEMFTVGAKLKFHCDCYITVTGADSAIGKNCVSFIRKGQILDFGRIRNGNYVYLAVTGGFYSQKMLGSRCFYQGITEKTCLQKGDRLTFNATNKPIINRTAVKENRLLFNATSIAVDKGPEFYLLGDNVQQILSKHTFATSAQSNRMAIKLEHDNPNLKAQEIITSSVQPGTIQLTPSGQLIALMRDCQTTGGYARVLQLPNFSINQLAQIPIHKAFSLIVQ